LLDGVAGGLLRPAHRNRLFLHAFEMRFAGRFGAFGVTAGLGQEPVLGRAAGGGGTRRPILGLSPRFVGGDLVLCRRQNDTLQRCQLPRLTGGSQSTGRENNSELRAQRTTGTMQTAVRNSDHNRITAVMHSRRRPQMRPS
jgi:hypothetical protein